MNQPYSVLVQLSCSSNIGLSGAITSVRKYPQSIVNAAKASTLQRAYFFTQASVERAMPVEDFAVKAMRHGLSGTLCDTVQDAVEKALRRARENDLIFIGGSTFIVADALPLFMKEDEYK